MVPTVVQQGANILSVQIALVIEQLSAWDEFICDFATGAITALAAELAPELIEV
jgi:hypothetical protein